MQADPLGPRSDTAALQERIRSKPLRDYLESLLLEICRIDTTPNADVAITCERELAVFDIIERELASLQLPHARLQRNPIDPDIQHHDAYSQLHYTKTDTRPNGLSPQEAYSGRFNLLLLVDGSRQREAGRDLAINAHIDVVAPYFPPRSEGGQIYGRGACDDKGNVVAMLGALKCLDEYLAERGRTLNRNLTGMFVIEEETGGNGSLSLALDRELKQRYEAMLILECCQQRIHPANRGAVWYRFDLAAPDISQFEMSAFVIERMEQEGRAIRAESRHPLFPQRPVQTCHGMMDAVGEHPSRICGRIAFTLQFDSPPDEKTELLVRDCIEAGVSEYIGLYGDKTKAPDGDSERPKVARHFDFQRQENGFLIDVHGSTGHMGAILENDGAITKMAALVRALVLSKSKLAELAGSPPTMELAGRTNPEFLRLEGGQGFVPTHGIEEVMHRMLKAAERGAEAYLSLVGRRGSGCDVVRGSYEKLHNAAYDGDPRSPAMQDAIAVARECGCWSDDEPVYGWTVSCDARLFANEYPGMPVITSGAGKLAYAHSDEEQVSLDELVQCVEFVTLYILKSTGTV